MGGLGIRHASDSAVPCFLSSFHACQGLINKLLPFDPSVFERDVHEAIDIWSNSKAPQPQHPDSMFQNCWEEPLFKKRYHELIENNKSSEDRARLLASSSRHAGDWLNTMPSSAIGTHLEDECFRVSTALRLGCGICFSHRCLCREVVSENGRHGLKCKKSAGRFQRHTELNDILYRALQAAQIPSRKEPLGCATQDGKRPDGVTLLPWQRGKCLVWDATCTDTFAQSYLPLTSIRPGAAAELAEERKHKKYGFLKDQYILKTVATETTGVLGKEALQLLNSIGKKISDVSGERRATNYLFQRISLALQRSNSICVLGTLPVGKSLNEVYYI